MSTRAVSQQICQPVEAAFGRSSDLATLVSDPTMQDLVELTAAETAENAAAAHNWKQENNQSPAAATILDLGCDACASCGICPVRVKLHHTDQLHRENAELYELKREITEAPWWLDIARTGSFPGGKTRIRELCDDMEALKAAWQTGNLEILLGAVSSCREVPSLSKDDAPELAHIASIPDGAALPTYAVTTRSGNQFVVVDASERFGTATNEQMRILCTKFVTRLNATASDGQSQIKHADNIMQKPILRGDTTIFEIRMDGKSRLYFMVSSQDQGPDRITLLGYHGSEEHTQKQAILRMVGDTRAWTRVA